MCGDGKPSRKYIQLYFKQDTTSDKTKETKRLNLNACLDKKDAAYELFRTQ